ncbi:MAG: choice-of-anchor Q domain-containing protein [Rhodanobacteraceae bacterium]
MSTCADDDSLGSLRAIIASPNTGDGDTIDLTQLPMGCSTITLDDATHVPSHITINQSSLYILGPDSHQLTIDGQGSSSVLRHLGSGTLGIKGVTIAHGKYLSATQPYGGCIYSKGSISLDSARVAYCTATTSGAVDARGGGVYAKNDLTLYRSSISVSTAYNTDTAIAYGNGGGAFVGGNLQATYATISDNQASGIGGGAYLAGSSISISSSTISANQARDIAGLYLSNGMGTAADITNSTISGNEATNNIGGLYVTGDLKLSNSTVAFNRDHYVNGSGLFAGGSSLQLESSIIAGNVGANGPADLYAPATTMVSGSHNLIVAGVSIPANTIRDCPQLDLLADNGGPTLTHAIRPTSPAFDAGSNPLNLPTDQTGYYNRVEGSAADIGALEWRAGITNERLFVGSFDGLCDQ